MASTTVRPHTKKQPGPSPNNISLLSQTFSTTSSSPASKMMMSGSPGGSLTSMRKAGIGTLSSVPQPLFKVDVTPEEAIPLSKKASPQKLEGLKKGPLSPSKRSHVVPAPLIHTKNVNKQQQQLVATIPTDVERAMTTVPTGVLTVNDDDGFTIEELRETQRGSWYEAPSFTISTKHITVPCGKPFTFPSFVRIPSSLECSPVEFLLQIEDQTLFDEVPTIDPSGQLTCFGKSAGITVVAIVLRNLADVDKVTLHIRESERVGIVIEVAPLSPTSKRKLELTATSTLARTLTNVVSPRSMKPVTVSPTKGDGFTVIHNNSNTTTTTTTIAKKAGNIHSFRVVHSDTIPTIEQRCVAMLRAVWVSILILVKKEPLRESIGIVGGFEPMQKGRELSKRRVASLYDLLEITVGEEKKFYPANDREIESGTRLVDALKEAGTIAVYAGEYSDATLHFQRAITIAEVVNPERVDLIFELKLFLVEAMLLFADIRSAMVLLDELQMQTENRYPSTHPTAVYILDLRHALETMDGTRNNATSSESLENVKVHVTATNCLSVMYQAFVCWRTGKKDVAIRLLNDVMNLYNPTSKANTSQLSPRNDEGPITSETIITAAVGGVLQCLCQHGNGKPQLALECLQTVRKQCVAVRPGDWVDVLSSFLFDAIQRDATNSEKFCSQICTSLGQNHPITVTMKVITTLLTMKPGQLRRGIINDFVGCVERQYAPHHPFQTFVHEILAEEWCHEHNYVEAQISFYKALQFEFEGCFSQRSHRLRERLCAMGSLVEQKPEHIHVGRVLMKMYKQYHSTVAEKFGLYDLEILPSTLDLAESLYFMGSYREALEVFLKALRIADSHNFVYILGGLFRPATELERDDTLERNRLALESLNGQTKDAIECAMILGQIAMCYEALGDLLHAQQSYCQSIACFEIGERPSHTGRIMAMDRLAHVLLGRGYIGESLGTLDECVVLLEDHHPSDRASLRRVIDHQRVVQSEMEKLGYFLVQHLWSRSANTFSVYV